ncbi:MAG: Spy/CpxP family protein refolding chaperone [Myxococcota bacterium]
MGGIFGVRRPLRFLAHKLDLDDEQIAQLAAIIDDLKTERAQAAVDNRRAQKLYMKAFSGDTFDAEQASEAAQRRVRTTESLQQAVTEALGHMHELLTPEQRRKMSTLIRSGVLDF